MRRPIKITLALAWLPLIAAWRAAGGSAAIRVVYESDTRAYYRPCG